MLRGAGGSGGGGTGTVTATGGSLTSNAVVLGAGTTDTKVSAGITTDGAGQLTLSQAVAATSTDGAILATTATATSGAQKYSPRLRWTGSGWKTNATAAAQAVSFIAELIPIQGAANPTGNLSIQASIDGGAYSQIAGFMSTGQLRLPNGSATAPSLNFDPTNSNPIGFSGIPNNLYTIVNGANVAVQSSDRFGLRSTGSVNWTSSSTSPLNGGNWDTGIARKAAKIIEINAGGTGTYAGVALNLGTQTVAQLTAAATAGEGAIAFVSDATATTPRSTVAGGGANKVMVMSDATNWLIVA